MTKISSRSIPHQATSSSHPKFQHQVSIPSTSYTKLPSSSSVHPRSFRFDYPFNKHFSGRGTLTRLHWEVLTMRPTLLLLASTAAAGPLAGCSCFAACSLSLLVCVELSGPFAPLWCGTGFTKCQTLCSVSMVLPGL
jgi:hypothetical protein